MNRLPGAKKERAAKRSTKTSAGKAVGMGAKNSDYVVRLAAALSEVSAAQNAWVQEMEAASRNPALLQDPACHARLSAAMASVVSAASHLRIQPVPDGMQAADQILGQARAEAELAAGTGEGGGLVSTEAIVGSIQHLDEMSQLLQQAYQLVRASSPTAR